MSDQKEQWAIVELFGHARIAGRISEQTIGGQSFVRVDVPEVTVFERGTAYPMQARLKYRIKDGALTLWYELVRAHKVLEAAFDDMREQIAADTGIVVWMGEP